MSSDKSVPFPGDSLQSWLSWLEALHHKSIDLGLDRIRQVADRLDLDWPAQKIIIGGTNGKGSTCAMLEAIYQAAGYRTGLYTSPHLVNFNERIRIDGQEASDAQIVEQLQCIEQARGEVSLTYFEYTTLAALLLFKQADAEVVILEVGLGGRFDAVNIIDADCSIVTCIDIDHTEYLGDTRDKIALEKAHIYCSGKPAICSDPEPPASLIEYAESIGADLRLFKHDFNFAGDRQQWSFQGRHKRKNALAYPALRGANQLLNASAALAAIESLDQVLPVQIQAIRQGLLNARLKGRFDILPGQPTVILDVAHNPHAVAVLAQNLQSMSFFPYTAAIFGMLNDKDCDTVIQKLGRLIDYWYCVDLEGPRGMTASELAARITKLLPADNEGLPTIKTFESPAAAYDQALADIGQQDRLLVFGSFMTVSGVLKHIGS